MQTAISLQFEKLDNYLVWTSALREDGEGCGIPRRKP